MTIRSSKPFLALLVLMLSTTLHADQIDEEIKKQLYLNSLEYAINVAKSKSELAKTLKECREYEGCPESVISLSTSTHSNDDAKSSDTLTLEKKEQAKKRQAQFKQLMQEVDSLSIDAIINQQVVFNKIDGSFGVGEAILGNIEILRIDNNSVHLGINKQLVKIVVMDWIKD